MAHTCSGSSIVTADLEDDDGLDSSSGLESSHEFSCILNALDVEQNTIRLRVRHQKVELVTKIEVGGNTSRNYSRESHVILFGPIQNGSAYRT